MNLKSAVNNLMFGVLVIVFFLDSMTLHARRNRSIANDNEACKTSSFWIGLNKHVEEKCQSSPYEIQYGDIFSGYSTDVRESALEAHLNCCVGSSCPCSLDNLELGKGQSRQNVWNLSHCLLSTTALQQIGSESIALSSRSYKEHDINNAYLYWIRQLNLLYSPSGSCGEYPLNGGEFPTHAKIIERYHDKHGVMGNLSSTKKLAAAALEKSKQTELNNISFTGANSKTDRLDKLYVMDSLLDINFPSESNLSLVNVNSFDSLSLVPDQLTKTKNASCASAYIHEATKTFFESCSIPRVISPLRELMTREKSGLFISLEQEQRVQKLLNRFENSLYQSRDIISNVTALRWPELVILKNPIRDGSMMSIQFTKNGQLLNGPILQSLISDNVDGKNAWCNTIAKEIVEPVFQSNSHLGIKIYELEKRINLSSMANYFWTKAKESGFAANPNNSQGAHEFCKEIHSDVKKYQSVLKGVAQQFVRTPGEIPDKGFNFNNIKKTAISTLIPFRLNGQEAGLNGLCRSPLILESTLRNVAEPFGELIRASCCHNYSKVALSNQLTVQGALLLGGIAVKSLQGLRAAKVGASVATTKTSSNNGLYLVGGAAGASAISEVLFPPRATYKRGNHSPDKRSDQNMTK